MRILLTGSTGQVGGALAPLLAMFGQVIAPTRAELDLSKEEPIRAFVRAIKPHWIINPAAYTAVDKAETERDLAYAINASAPRILGEEAKALGANVIHFSTDYVFDGTKAQPYTEVDRPNPVNVYGASKLAGEQALAATGAAHIVLRTSWVYSAAGKNFLTTILNAARTQPEIRIVADQLGAPTAARDLAALTAHILTTNANLAGKSGIFHAASSGETTWHGFAQQIIREAQILESATAFAALTPIATSEYPTPAARPANSRLDCSKLSNEFNYRLPPWQASLAEVMAGAHRVSRRDAASE